MRGTCISRLRVGTSKLLRDQGGNAMMLTAAMIVPIIGIAGSGIDIGRAYMAQLRLQQACDAGVLAGRRAQAGGTYTSAAKAEATKMFAFNFPNNAYDSSRVSFQSVASGTTNVNGTATAHVPPTVMRVFAHDGFDLTVNCTAKLEISNADIMLVLDVTGSMDTVNSGDSVSRLEGLKAASIAFFDTLTNAELGDGRLRFGIVPYSGTVNVGAILNSANPSWISDRVTFPSRTPFFKTVYGTGTTSTGTATNSSTSAGTWGSWADFSSTQANCKTPNQPAATTPTASGSPSTTSGTPYIDGNGNQITDSNTTQNYTYRENEYRWNSNKCQRRQRTMTYTQTTPSKLTQPPVQQFDYFRYHNRELDVSRGKGGADMTFNTFTKGTDLTASWDGCIIEADTKPFTSTQTAPADAYDMNVDLVPTSDDATKWKMFLPDFGYSRSSQSATTSTSTSKVNSFEDQAIAGDYAACPSPAMKLTTMTKNDRATFVSQIGKLKAHGYTYHDVGMIWGARLLSPDGIFKSENATAPNNRPIARHIVFMTDGEPTAPVNNFSFQSQEQSTGRIGAGNETEAVKRHTNRFLQICEAAKGKNVTIWVVGFGTSITTALKTCATPGKTYSAANSAQLNENFQAIARQISKLRLSQ